MHPGVGTYNNTKYTSDKYYGACFIQYYLLLVNPRRALKLDNKMSRHIHHYTCIVVAGRHAEADRWKHVSENHVWCYRFQKAQTVDCLRKRHTI